MMRTLALVLLLSAAATPALAVPGISRQQIITIAKSGVGCPYKWGGTCWDPNNKSWKGADCSGYATVCWQIPSTSKTTDCLPHYYTSSAYKSQSTSWSSISRNDLLEGDLLTSGSHVVIYAGGDKWGSAQVYEARGSAYGIVHRTRSLSSSFVARRRDNLTAGTGPGPTGHPNLSIATNIAPIGGQTVDFCKQGSSSGVFDWHIGQATSVNVDVFNGGQAKADGVRLGLQVAQPYVRVTHWAIYSHPAAGSFALSSVDGIQSVPRTNPGATFTLELKTIAPGETFRVTLQVKATAHSAATSDHPGVKAWISKVEGYYLKSGYFAPPQNNQNLQTYNGGELRSEVGTDVLEPERCDGKDNDCDGKTDEGCPAKPKPKQPDAGNGTSPGQNPGTRPNVSSNPGGSQSVPGQPGGQQNQGTGATGGGVIGGCSFSGGGPALPDLAWMLLLLLLAVTAAGRGATSRRPTPAPPPSCRRSSTDRAAARATARR
jgi:hypothetical protein